MDQLGDKFNPKELIMGLKDESEKRALQTEQEKEKLKQEIMHDFNDADSAPFWNKCFDKVPFKTIKVLISNMKSLENDEYHIRNKSAFFINLLKKQGLFPFVQFLMGFAFYALLKYLS